MKTLYVSDLDGTLLGNDEKTTAFTNCTINSLVEKGMLFSYATARSFVTASKVTSGIVVNIPIIVYNGAATVKNLTGEVIERVTFGPDEKAEIFEGLMSAGVCPLVYAFIGGREAFSYVYDSCSSPLRDFIDTRHGDPRDNPLNGEEELLNGDVFYFTCIDTPQKLFPLYEQFRDKYSCFYERNLYTGKQWLELIPKGVSKASAILRLKKLMNVDRVVVFGDGLNDTDMFKIADEAYAVGNAAPELKALATGVIRSNSEDGVVNWLIDNFNVNSEE